MSVLHTPYDALSVTPSGTMGGDIQRLLELARVHLNMDIAWMSEFGQGMQIIRAASGDIHSMNVELDQGTDLDGSFCIRVLSGALPPVISHARLHPLTRDLPVTSALGIGSYIGVPWRDSSGDVAGMLCCLSRGPTLDLDPQAVSFLELLAALISDHLASPEMQARRLAADEREQVSRLLETAQLQVVFQPVVRLDEDRVVAFEALSRFPNSAFATPAHAFAAASRSGLGPELELLAIERAFEQLDDLFAGIWMNVNLSAEALEHQDIRALLRAHADRNIAVELTEHTQIRDYPHTRRILDGLREAGIQIVIDDAGAGFASLQHILQLDPDVIKLDISIVRGLDADPARRAMARSLFLFAEETDAVVIAEGIETKAERDAVLDLGIRLGQGYYMARPSPLPSQTAE